MAAVSCQSPPGRPPSVPLPTPGSLSSPSTRPSRPTSRLLSSQSAASSSPHTPPVARAPLVWRKRIPLSFAYPQYVATAYISNSGRIISRKRDDKQASQSAADRRRATSAARSRIRDRAKNNATSATAAGRKEELGRQRPGASDERWADREGWRTVDQEDDGEEKIEQEDGAVRRQPSAATAILLAYPRPLPLPPSQSFSPLLSPSLLSLSMRYWQTFHPPLTAGCWLPRSAYLHLRLLTLRSALLSASHGHLSLRSVALLSHLDWYEDSAEQLDEDEVDDGERAAVSNGMRLPVFHRALLTWAMLHLGVNERTAQLEPLEQCILTLYDQLTHDAAEPDDSSEEPDAGSSPMRRYLPLTADDEFMLREMSDDAAVQWQRATVEHNKRKRLLSTNNSDDSATASPPTSTHTTASIVQRMEERKEALAIQQSMPPLLAGAVSVLVRRYPSGSEIRQQARRSADKPTRAVSSRERQLSSSTSLSPTSSSALNRGAGLELFGLSAPQSLSPVKLVRVRSSTSAVSPTANRSAAVTGKGGGRPQLSQSPPPGLSSYGQQPQWSPSVMSLGPSLRGDMATSFASMSLRISPVARQTSGTKQR